MVGRTYEDIEVRSDDGIAVLTLRRPEVRNALRHQTFAELEAAVLACSERVLIVTGEDPGELVDAAQSLARRIAANPPLAVQAIKEGMCRALDPDWASLGRWVSETLDRLFQTEDHREGVRSFLEKRSATFVGR